jgi:CHAT domain-containing protein
LGEYAKAEPLHKEALRIRQKVFGPEHPEVAQSLNNLALLYKKMGEYAKAEPLYQESLRIRQKVLGSEHPDTAESLNNLASLYEYMGEYAKAEPRYQEALEIFRERLGPEHPETTTSLNNLGALYDLMGEYAKAEPLYQEALRIRQKVLGPEHPDTATSLQNLACCEFNLDRIDDTIALARQATAAELTILSKIFSFTSEEQRLAYLAICNPYTLLALLKGTEIDLASAVLRYKGVVLDSIVEDRLLAEASHGSKDQKLLEQLNQDKRQLGQLLLQPVRKVSAQTTQRIEALEGEVEKIEGQLAQHVAGLGQARHALSVSLQQVQSAIPNDGALIEYLRNWHYLGKNQWEERYGAIVLFSKGAPLWIPLGKANEIEHLVRRYGALVRGSPQDDELSANLQALYEALWTPIGQALPNQTKTIIISPDGALNFVSFATLLTKDKQFLAQTYSVQYVASGRDLLRELKPSTAKEVVLFANPNFKLGSTVLLAKADNGSSDPGPKRMRGSEKRDVEDWSFESLEGTQNESDELVKKFDGWGWKPSDFTAGKATKEALLKIHSPYILHLATHGFFAKEDPANANTELESPLNDQQRVTKSKFFKNPMHRSGLALAGAQTTIEAWKREEVPPVENDGILTAEDVSTLDLQGTWLVTLSACDTGSGEARTGEGVMGLRRGFIQAGAQNLLMTLWPISDKVTVQIMSDFYEAAHNSGNAPEALAEVQRNWLLKLRTEKGLAQAVNLAGPFIMSSQGKP